MIGMAVTFRNMLSTPVTIQYPEVKRTMPKRYRGRHFLNRDEDGGLGSAFPGNVWAWFA